MHDFDDIAKMTLSHRMFWIKNLNDVNRQRINFECFEWVHEVDNEH